MAFVRAFVLSLSLSLYANGIGAWQAHVVAKTTTDFEFGATSFDRQIMFFLRVRQSS